MTNNNLREWHRTESSSLAGTVIKVDVESCDTDAVSTAISLKGPLIDRGQGELIVADIGALERLVEILPAAISAMRQANA